MREILMKQALDEWTSDFQLRSRITSTLSGTSQYWYY
jgi:hypothetical protein